MRWRCQRNVVTSLNRKLKNENLKEKINALLDSKKSPYKYHQIIKSITGFKRSSTIPPLTVGDDILSEDHHKAHISTHISHNKQILMFQIITLNRSKGTNQTISKRLTSSISLPSRHERCLKSSMSWTLRRPVDPMEFPRSSSK